MPRIDLNIVDRGIQGTEWIAEDVGLTADHLDEVMEQKTDNSSALNSLPTPFARFFVAREAFRRAMEEHLNPRKEAGFAYRQLVSDILDVYELIFNIKYHRNNSWKSGQKLELREWKSKENLAYMKKKMPVLYNSVDHYYRLTSLRINCTSWSLLKMGRTNSWHVVLLLQDLLHLLTWIRQWSRRMEQQS